MQKGINKWEDVKVVFRKAYVHYVKRTGPASEQEFLHFLIKDGSRLEMKRLTK